MKWISWQTFSFLFGWLLANYSLISMKLSVYWKLSCTIANWEVIITCFEEPISHLCVIYFCMAWNLIANESFMPLAVSRWLGTIWASSCATASSTQMAAGECNSSFFFLWKIGLPSVILKSTRQTTMVCWEKKLFFSLENRFTECNSQKH